MATAQRILNVQEQNRILKAGTVFLSMIIPASGYIILNKQIRGAVMLVWMVVMGFITYQLTDERISFIGRYSGGFAVWVFSVLEVHSMVFKRNKKA